MTNKIIYNKEECIKKMDSIKKHIIDDLERIIDKCYIYSVDNIVDKLKIQRVYIQKEFIKNMDVFHLNQQFKLYCKSCMGNEIAYKALSDRYELCLSYEEFLELNADTISMIEAAKLDRYKISRRILVSEIELLEVIQNKFMLEVEYLKGDTYVQKYFNINAEHAQFILIAGLKNQSDLKKLYNVRTELQVYRRLRKNTSLAFEIVFAKYVIPSKSDTKKSMARYLTAYDFPDYLKTSAKEFYYDIKTKTTR